MKINSLKKELKEASDPKRAEILQRFFKTKKGEYGYGDIFLGIAVPEQRKIIKKYKHLKLKEITELLQSKIHEHRFCALALLIEKYKKGNEKTKKEVVKIYLENTKYINNWDLVDISAYKIIGHYLYKKPKKILYQLAKSLSLWERRIAIVTTFYFIKNGNNNLTFELAKILLKDKEDLIHKATGWMLREAGKRDEESLNNFLESYSKEMPRTMLRYSIEKFNKKEKNKFLKFS